MSPRYPFVLTNDFNFAGLLLGRASNASIASYTSSVEELQQHYPFALHSFHYTSSPSSGVLANASSSGLVHFHSDKRFFSEHHQVASVSFLSLCYLELTLSISLLNDQFDAKTGRAYSSNRDDDDDNEEENCPDPLATQLLCMNSMNSMSILASITPRSESGEVDDHPSAFSFQGSTNLHPKQEETSEVDSVPTPPVATINTKNKQMYHLRDVQNIFKPLSP